MRKLCFVLTALLLAVPAMATITFSGAQVAPASLDAAISYNAVADGNMPRAFGLNITVSAGTIASIPSHNASFWVHPGTIVIAGGNVTDEGNPVAPSADPCALGGLGTSGITIEMGSLYDPCDPCHPTGPATSGELLRIRLGSATDCTVTVSGNAARGNVVNESTDEAATNLPIVIPMVFDCFPSGHPDYSIWVARGKPSCWCAQYGSRQCHGDASSDREGTSKKGYYYVGGNDLNVLIAGWLKKEPPKGSGILGRTATIGTKQVPIVCADFGHDREGTSKKGYYYIGGNDLNILIAYWLKKEPPKGSGTPTNCPD